jgi:hypothetical protein
MTKYILNKHKKKCNVKEDINEDKIKSVLTKLVKNEVNQQAHNINSNNNINSNLNSNNTINVHINNFGDENITYLQNKKILESISDKPARYIEQFIRNIHYHPNHKENHNIKICKEHPNSVCIRKNGELVFKNKKETINDMIDLRDIDFKQLFYEYASQIDKKTRQKIYKCLYREKTKKDKLRVYHDVVNIMLTHQQNCDYSSWIK